jgi:hypothetical protein
LGTGLAPAFSISGRGKSPIDERVLNPGPGAYESGNQDKYKARSPSYSISSRTNIPTDQTQKPGPGAHSPEKVRLFNSIFTCRKLFSSRKLSYQTPTFFLFLRPFLKPIHPYPYVETDVFTELAPPNSLFHSNSTFTFLRPRTHLILQLHVVLFLLFLSYLSFLFNLYHQIQIKQESSPAHTFGMKHSPYLGKLKGL